MSSRFTIRSRLRQLVVVLAALIVLVAAVATGFLAKGVAEVRARTVMNGPAVDTNDRLLQSMTDAETGLRGYAASHNPAMLEPFSRAHARAEANLADLDRLLGARGGRWADLLGGQRAAVEQWWAYADAGKVHLDQGGELDVLRGKHLLDRLRTVNGQIDIGLREQRAAMRLQARSTLTLALWVVAASAALAVAVALLGGYRISQSLTGPLADLRAVVRRQRDGDTGARADTEHGAADVRALAEASTTSARRTASCRSPMPRRSACTGWRSTSRRGCGPAARPRRRWTPPRPSWAQAWRSTTSSSSPTPKGGGGCSAAGGTRAWRSSRSCPRSCCAAPVSCRPAGGPRRRSSPSTT